MQVSWRNEAYWVPAGSPARVASWALPTLTTGSSDQASERKAQPRASADGETPPKPCSEPVTCHTPSRARVSNGITRPSCCTGRRRSVSTCAASGTAALNGASAAAAKAAGAGEEQRQSSGRSSAAARTARFFALRVRACSASCSAFSASKRARARACTMRVPITVAMPAMSRK